MKTTNFPSASRCKKFLCLLLALLMLIPLTMGCKKTDENQDTATQESSGYGNAVQTDGNATVTMTETDLSEYAIVRPENATSALVASAVSLKKALDEVTGKDAKLDDDYLPSGSKPDDTRPEILVGLTNRPQSSEGLAQLADTFSYTITQINKKIVIMGPTPEVVTKGVEFFIKTYLTPAKGKGTVALPTPLKIVGDPLPYHEIISAAKPNYTLVYSKNASGTEQFEAVKSLMNKLNELCQTPFMLQDDWIKNGESHDLSQNAIVVGYTTYPISQQLLNESGMLSWKMMSDGNQIYLSAAEVDALDLAISAFLKRFADGTMFTDPTTIRLCHIEKTSGSVTSWEKQIPAFEGGEFSSSSAFANGYYRLHYTNTTLNAYLTYLDVLKANGFTQYAENRLDDNRYTTFRTNDLMLHAYYVKENQSVSILAANTKNAVPYPTAPTADTTVTDPSLTMMALNYDANQDGEYDHNNGMGFVYTLADGSYVLIDGGYGTDTIPLYEYLQKNNKRTDGKILIRAWIITHPDGDHYGCFNEFARLYAADVTLEYFVAQFNIKQQKGKYAAVIRTILTSAKKFAGAKHIVPLPGQQMYFGTLKIDFYYTAEMYHPYGTPAANESSLAFMGTLKGTKVFFGGDIVGNALTVVDKVYSDSLKCDFLQAPHHGLNGTNGFYSKTRPSYLLMCTHQTAADERWEQGRYANQSKLNYLKGLKCVKQVYVADGGNTVLTF